MAKQTRAQRRARRQEETQQPQPTVQRARSRQQPVRPAQEPPASQAGPRRAPGGGFRRFVAESWAELQKVEWPRQQQLVQGTAVVLIACVVVGTFLFACDQLFKRLVENVLLGQ